MRFLVLWLGLFPAATATAFTINRTVLDPSAAAIAGAQVSAVNRLGVAQQTTTDQAGGFTLKLSGTGEMHLAITAPGFETKSIPLAGASAPDPLTEQGSRVTIVPREEIAERNEGLAVDLLRYLPGITIGQSGSPGGVASMFIRGGDLNFTLV